VAEPIEFYFDFASPYGYLASTQIDRIAEKHGRSVAWRPVLLGAIFKTTGMQPLMNVPLKGEYMKRDMARFARLLGVPITEPEVFPINGLAPSRAFYWLDLQDPAKAKSFAQAVFAEHFVRGRDVSQIDTVAHIGAGLGFKPDELVAGTQQQSVKDRLREEVERATERGVFGSPFFFVDGESFWGADRLDQVDRWLATGGF
jgi:2-hydroxychromene-2-carboxylate isomerase